MRHRIGGVNVSRSALSLNARTVQCASKRRQTPCFLPRFSVNARMNYELIKISLWSDPTPKPPPHTHTDTHRQPPSLRSRRRHKEQGSMVALCPQVCCGYLPSCELENVCVEFVSPGKMLNISWRGINSGRTPPPPLLNLSRAAIRAPLFFSQTLVLRANSASKAAVSSSCDDRRSRTMGSSFAYRF